MSLQGGRSACPVPSCAVDPELSLHLDWMQPRGQARSGILLTPYGLAPEFAPFTKAVLSSA